MDREKRPHSTITATELKQHLGMYLDYVMANNEVVVTKNGEKVVRLTPYLSDLERYLEIRERAVDYLGGGKRVSYEEFLEISAKSEARLEYIDEEIVLLASPTASHQEVSGNLYVRLREYLRSTECQAYYAPFDVHLHKPGVKNPDVVQPDLIVACDLEKLTEDGRYMGTPTLVVEILSPSTRQKDMVDKLRSYMLGGVEEYWIIDPDNRKVLLYSFAERNIRDLSEYRLGEVVQSACFPGLEVPVSAVFES
ncbi:MAG TPA: type II toxin-antitoxin system Phd/YefM family antitoxin [Firmicutes bacterium]|jgi:prevent-host-death family protein|nr:MAG: prevent-host-death protein [Peptococcaceae bacterium 1109]HHT73726.1 type II toxin-antitoxin system Phd/YefM family antitoxin [Bacillota bacterium]